ncbi:hit domain-containing protein [Xylariaceae sp. FL0255]|nr:hit domain-containing protein [Xylariaceae sp. FL0255]
MNGTTTNNKITPPPPKGPIHFGPYEVTTQVFLTTPHSFAVVNIKPLLPGHVLVCPRAPHKRLTDLSAAELTDLFSTVQRVQHMLARYYFFSAAPSSSSSSSPSTTSSSPSSPSTSTPQDIPTPSHPYATPYCGSFNIAVQDGREAGQTVPHVHVHVIPRIRGSNGKNPNTDGDELYVSMANETGNAGGAFWDRERELEFKERPKPGGAFPRIEDQDREARTMEEMEAEADLFRSVLASMEDEGK